MERWAVVAVVMVSGCTALNPAFGDEGIRSSSGGLPSSETGDIAEATTGGADGSGTTEVFEGGSSEGDSSEGDALETTGFDDDGCDLTWRKPDGDAFLVSDIGTSDLNFGATEIWDLYDVEGNESVLLLRLPEFEDFDTFPEGALLRVHVTLGDLVPDPGGSLRVARLLEAGGEPPCAWTEGEANAELQPGAVTWSDCASGELAWPGGGLREAMGPPLAVLDLDEWLAEPEPYAPVFPIDFDPELDAGGSLVVYTEGVDYDRLFVHSREWFAQEPEFELCQ